MSVAPASSGGGAGAAWQGLHGLYVDASGWDYEYRRWVRPPVARFTCTRGCSYSAIGFLQVQQLVSTVHARHARDCPRE